ncbi:Acetyltransferase (GNAT) family protein [Kosakonia arachidis]|uniref:Acetyltransferase (GNAT) family protein n=1 Tax=Kosakonia arachidis TaxID=551989 RepID=A0A1I7B473_9ENTR|nr:GNAT family N-acetyltransferase [Kosakonia arachidis]SFT82023.1 Acetyltransferase (GNAT) family protein [Kosakonia arachidis]
MKILPLYEVPHFATQVIEWLWHEFGYSLPRNFFASIIDHSQMPGALPLTFVLVDGDELLATVGLWRCDLISRQDLFPWLAALYVKESARGQGLAGQLQQHVMVQAKAMGFNQLHLYSACRDFYERYGWEYIGDGLDYPNTLVHLYRIAL